MKGQGVVARQYVTAHVQERVCECPAPAVFEDDFDCMKCGYATIPNPPLPAPSWAEDRRSAA